MENEFEFINRSKRPLALPPAIIFPPTLENSECSPSKFSKLKKGNEVECVFSITIPLPRGDSESMDFPLVERGCILFLGTFSLYSGGQLHGATSSGLLESVKITMGIVSTPHPLWKAQEQRNNLCF